MGIIKHILPNGQRCTYCGINLVAPTQKHNALPQKFDASRDHVLPQAVAISCDGAIEGAGYWVWSCWTCNNLRADMPQHVFAWAVGQSTAANDKERRKEFQRLRFLLMAAGFEAARKLHGGQIVPSSEVERVRHPRRDRRGRFTADSGVSA